jgi:hypothetical protein
VRPCSSLSARLPARTENSIRVDHVSESPNFSGDDRSVLRLPLKSKSRLEAENAAVCTDSAWAQEHSLHRAGAGLAQEFLEVTMATPEKPRETYSPAPSMT